MDRVLRRALSGDETKRHEILQDNFPNTQIRREHQIHNELDTVDCQSRLFGINATKSKVRLIGRRLSRATRWILHQLLNKQEWK